MLRGHVSLLEAVSAFSTLRTYALSGKRKWVPVAMLLLGLVLPTAEAVSVVHPIDAHESL